jgi:glycerophosphoryl diester phosphodiesterase
MTVNPWLERRVFHWAHRGGGREGPSNTLYSMQHAVDVGASGLELDVHRTKDGHLVVAHDDDLRSMTGAEGRISTSTLAHLRTLDAAHQWVPGEVAVADAPAERYTLRGAGPGPRSPELGIPTLAEVLARYPNVPLNLEIKRWRGALPMAKALRGLSRDDIIVVSIRPWALWLFRLRARGVKVAPSPVGLFAIWLASRVRLPLPFPGSVAIQPPLKRKGKLFTDRRLVETAHKAGLAVHVWTVDARAEIEEALDLGVDGIMTDCPTVLAEVLAERGVGWRRPG